MNLTKNEITLSCISLQRFSTPTPQPVEKFLDPCLRQDDLHRGGLGGVDEELHQIGAGLVVKDVHLVAGQGLAGVTRGGVSSREKQKKHYHEVGFLAERNKRNISMRWGF